MSFKAIYWCCFTVEFSGAVDIIKVFSRRSEMPKVNVVRFSAGGLRASLITREGVNKLRGYFRLFHLKLNKMHLAGVSSCAAGVVHCVFV